MAADSTILKLLQTIAVCGEQYCRGLMGKREMLALIMTLGKISGQEHRDTQSVAAWEQERP